MRRTATPPKRLHRVTIRNHLRGLAGRGGPDRRSRLTIKLLNKHIADKLSGPWSETGSLHKVQGHRAAQGHRARVDGVAPPADGDSGRRRVGQ